MSVKFVDFFYNFYFYNEKFKNIQTNTVIFMALLTPQALQSQNNVNVTYDVTNDGLFHQTFKPF